MRTKRLSDIRESANMTPAQIAQMLGITETAYLLKESGQMKFKAHEVIMIAHALKVRPDNIELN